MAPSDPARRFRFRPRLNALPWAVSAISAVLMVLGLSGQVSGPSRTFCLAVGAIGVALATLYRMSPAWKLEVVVSDQALDVVRKGETRLHLPWAEVRRLVASPSTKTCFVDGGTAKRSLLVPGPGAPGPYQIERREELYELIRQHVPSDRIHDVSSLDATRPEA